MTMSDAEERLDEIEDAVRAVEQYLSDFTSDMLDLYVTLQSLLDELQQRTYSKLAAAQKVIQIQKRKVH